METMLDSLRACLAWQNRWIVVTTYLLLILRFGEMMTEIGHYIIIRM